MPGLNKGQAIPGIAKERNAMKFWQYSREGHVLAGSNGASIKHQEFFLLTREYP